MKVLYYNCVYRPGHFYYDTKLITYLAASTDELIVLQPSKWFEEKYDNVTFINKAVSQKKKPGLRRISTWTRSFLNSVLAIREIKKQKPDAVVVGEYELSTFWLTIKKLTSICKTVVIVHHNNIDQISKNERKKRLFYTYKDKVVHCTLEPFISDFVCDQFEIDRKRVVCWPHPSESLNPSEALSVPQNKKKYDLIGLSQSNDEQLIDHLIKLEKTELPFQKSGLRVLLKSKVQTFDNGSLTVIKGWIDTDTYKKYYQNAKCVLVAFPQSYQYRVSATLIEAIRDKIPIIGADIQLIKYYNSIFPNICSIYSENSFVDDVLHSLVQSKEQETEFTVFIETHSDKYISGIIKHDLLKLMNNNIS